MNALVRCKRCITVRQVVYGNHYSTYKVLSTF